MCLKVKQGEESPDIYLNSIVEVGIVRCGFCELTDDLMAEILCRLPLKCLIRCKILCKVCCRVITDICVPKVSSSTSVLGFLYRTLISGDHERGPSVQFLPYKIPASPNPATINRPYSELLPFNYGIREFCDCCNGLVLFVDSSVPQFYVLNPTTKQCIKIPRHVLRNDFQHAALAFNPLRSQHYKVVNLCIISEELEVDVFSSETGKWVAFSFPLKTLEGYYTVFKRTVYNDDALYRLCYMGHGPIKKHLMRIDLHNYKVQLFERPDRDLATPRGFLGVSRGSLCYSYIDDSTCFVWSFEYGHEKAVRWTLKHKICLMDLIDSALTKCGAQLTNATRFNPQACDPNSDDLFFMNANVMVRYRPKDKKVQVLYRMSGQSFITIATFGMLTYSPCLVMLKNF